MSVKIYNGYKLDDSKNIFEFRKEFTQLAQREYLNYVIEQRLLNFVTIFDRITLGDRKALAKTKNALKVIRREAPIPPKNKYVERFFYVVDSLYAEISLEEAHKWEKEKEESSLGEVVLLHNHVRDENYFIFFGRGQLGDKIETLDGVSYYGYWNNTDHPEGVTDKEWNDRGEAWEEAMDDPGAPVRVQGFIIDPIVSSSSLLFYDNFFEEFEANKEDIILPDLGTRVSTYLSRVVSSKVVKKLKQEKYKWDGSFSRFFQETDSFKGTDEYTQLKEKVERMLQPLTSDMILDYWHNEKRARGNDDVFEEKDV